jgi:hypothetical protein
VCTMTKGCKVLKQCPGHVFVGALGAPDSLGGPPDSMVGPPDSLDDAYESKRVTQLPPDSLGGSPDSPVI